jgi:hypothetical protein
MGARPARACKTHALLSGKSHTVTCCSNMGRSCRRVREDGHNRHTQRDTNAEPVAPAEAWLCCHALSNGRPSKLGHRSRVPLRLGGARGVRTCKSARSGVRCRGARPPRTGPKGKECQKDAATNGATGPLWTSARTGTGNVSGDQGDWHRQTPSHTRWPVPTGSGYLASVRVGTAHWFLSVQNLGPRPGSGPNCHLLPGFRMNLLWAHTAVRRGATARPGTRVGLWPSRGGRGRQSTSAWAARAALEKDPAGLECPRLRKLWERWI